MMVARLTATLALVLSFAVPAHAADDAAYCRALAAKYQATIVKSSGHSPNPGTADGSVAADQCLHGNTAGIPVLERKLRDAKIELPARG